MTERRIPPSCSGECSSRTPPCYPTGPGPRQLLMPSLTSYVWSHRHRGPSSRRLSQTTCACEKKREKSRNKYNTVIQLVSAQYNDTGTCIEVHVVTGIEVVTGITIKGHTRIFYKTCILVAPVVHTYYNYTFCLYGDLCIDVHVHTNVYSEMSQ